MLVTATATTLLRLILIGIIGIVVKSSQCSVILMLIIAILKVSLLLRSLVIIKSLIVSATILIKLNIHHNSYEKRMEYKQTNTTIKNKKTKKQKIQEKEMKTTKAFFHFIRLYFKCIKLRIICMLFQNFYGFGK